MNSIDRKCAITICYSGDKTIPDNAKNECINSLLNAFPLSKKLILDLNKDSLDKAISDMAELKELLRICDNPPVIFDDIVKANHLLEFSIPTTIFLVDKESFSKPFFRNLFLLVADSSQLKSNVLCVPLGFNVSIEELKDTYSQDEHLIHSLKRMHFFQFESSELPDIISNIDKWINDIDKYVKYDMRNGAPMGALRKLMASIVACNWIITPIAIIAGLFILISKAIGKMPDFGFAFKIEILLCYLVGYFLSTVPASPAFNGLKKDIRLRRNKAFRFNLMVGIPTALFIYIAVIYRTNFFPMVAIPIGLFIGLFEQEIRPLSNSLYMKLQGLDNYFENLLARSARYFPFLSGKSLPQIWNWCAARFTACRRDSLYVKPDIFISYTWNSESDKSFAKQIAKALESKGLKFFLDIADKPYYPFWRTRISERLMSASHMLFIASETSVTNANTCSEELKQALSAMHLSNRPTIAFYLLNSSTQNLIQIASSEQAKYVLSHAYHLEDNVLMDPHGFALWLKNTLPNTWIQDLCHASLGLIRSSLFLLFSLGLILWGIWGYQLISGQPLSYWFRIGVIVFGVGCFLKACRGFSPSYALSFIENHKSFIEKVPNCSK